LPYTEYTPLIACIQPSPELMKKNLLLFTSTFPRWPSDQDIPLFVYELGKELTRHFNVFVLSPHAPGAKKEEVMDQMRVIRFPYFYPDQSQSLAYGSGILANLKSNRGALLQIPSFLFCQWRALKKTIRRHNIDVINSHWMIPQGWIASFLPQSDSVKHVLTIHAAGLFALRRLAFGKCMARRIVDRSDLIYCVSRYNHEVLEKLTGHTVESRILPMGIHTGYYSELLDTAPLRRELQLESEKVILYVGKLNEKKGVTYLLKAFEKIKDEVSSTQLVIVGTGILEDTLKHETHKAGLSPRVHFAGSQNKETVRKYFKAADVVAVPSIIDSGGETEGLPVVLLEALACGKPVVATRVGGAPDAIRDGHNGFLVPPKDPDSLALKLKEALQGESASLSQNAMQSVQLYDWQRIGQDYADNISKLFHSTGN